LFLHSRAKPVVVTGEEAEWLGVALRIVKEIERTLRRWSGTRITMRKVLFVAGEASGDLHAGRGAALNASGRAIARGRRRPTTGEEGVQLIHATSSLA